LFICCNHNSSHIITSGASRGQVNWLLADCLRGKVATLVPAERAAPKCRIRTRRRQGSRLRHSQPRTQERLEEDWGSPPREGGKRIDEGPAANREGDGKVVAYFSVQLYFAVLCADYNNAAVLPRILRYTLLQVLGVVYHIIA
jgi:hypothetical protein